MQYKSMADIEGTAYRFAEYVVYVCVYVCVYFWLFGPLYVPCMNTNCHKNKKCTKMYESILSKAQLRVVYFV